MNYHDGIWRCDEGEFSHTGKLGDLVYALAAIRWWSIRNRTLATLILVGDEERQTNDAEKRTHREYWRDCFASIRSLLLLQSYLKTVIVCEQNVQCAMRGWNDWWNHGAIPKRHLHTVGCEDPAVLHEPWIAVENPKRVASCIFNWTDRYPENNNPHFPWAQLARRFAGDAVFVGSSEEYERWCSKLAGVPLPPHHKVRDILELSEVIAGADLFVGRPSLPHAIAAALRKLRILEGCLHCDVHWGAPECILLSRHRHLTEKRLDWYLQNRHILQSIQ